MFILLWHYHDVDTNAASIYRAASVVGLATGAGLGLSGFKERVKPRLTDREAMDSSDTEL